MNRPNSFVDLFRQTTQSSEPSAASKIHPLLEDSIVVLAVFVWLGAMILLP